MLMTHSNSLTIALTVSILSGLAACAGNGTPTASPANAAPDATAGMDTAKSPAIELVFSHALRGQAATAIEDAVAAFDRSRPDVSVTIRKEDRAGYESGLENAILSGNGPDVFLAGDMFAMEWIERKHLAQPLDRLLTARGVSLADRWQRKYVSRVSSAGLLYAVPLAVNVPILVANPDLVKGSPVMSASPAANVANPIALDASDWLHVAAFMGAFDAAVVDPAGAPVFDSGTTVTAIRFMGENLAGGGLHDAGAADAVMDLFNSGAVPAAIVQPCQASLISPDKPWIFMPMPSIGAAGRVTPFWQVDALYVSSWSRNLEAAADLLAWLSSDTGIDALARDGFPGLFTTTREMSTEYAGGKLSRAIRTQQAAAVPSPAFPTFQTIADIFRAAAMPLLEGPAPSQDAIRNGLSDAAGRARAADTKIRRGESLILR